MEAKHKIGLALIGAVATAGIAYCAYLHKDDITAKIDALKDEIIKKKNELGEAGSKRIADIIDKLVVLLEKHASGKHTAEELVARDNEITKLKEELEDLKK